MQQFLFWDLRLDAGLTRKLAKMTTLTNNSYYVDDKGLHKCLACGKRLYPISIFEGEKWLCRCNEEHKKLREEFMGRWVEELKKSGEQKMAETVLRSPSEIVHKMLSIEGLPIDLKVEFEKLLDDFSYSPPELSKRDVMKIALTVNKYVQPPGVEDWHREILAVWMNIPIDRAIKLCEERAKELEDKGFVG
jgi:hypothetical protein